MSETVDIAEQPAAITVSGIDVRRGESNVLHSVSLVAPVGTVTGLLGPSGCGKSTLMRAIVGVQDHVEGRIEVLGKPAGSASLRSLVGYVTQAPSVYADLSVSENLRYFAKIARAGRDRIAEVIDTVGLHGFEDRVTGSLSGGQRSRVSLASALLGSPEVLVLDEPTVGLDPVIRAELWRTFHALADSGTTLLVSSHVMDEAGECDRLLLMREGRMLRDTTPAALREESGEEDLQKAFLAVIESEGS
ncbi:MAG: ABC transporter ATP-binding protein [Solirubrobacterales bacterium]|nr:ABC transporter ATP-binding protein [Solirubrobacterales bacterium]MCB8971879.1 ABC transporter ATP-binding protein [Thermoleophilales bacterium]MCO5326316.1 ABC transporter ATP-binding protein [Solirubrobacterales bacterium]